LKALIEVLSTLIFTKSYDFGPANVISFGVESPVDSPIQDLNYAKELGFRSRIGLKRLLGISNAYGIPFTLFCTGGFRSRIGLKRLLGISNAYGIPFTLFCTGHALLKWCKGHKTVIKILKSKKSRRYNLHVGEYLWHAVGACSNVFVQGYGKSLTAIYVSENL